MLSQHDRERYSRQISLPGFGEEAQARLRNSSALVIGAGGLGSPVALYLTAAGVGRLGLVEHDTVDLSNLHRQLLHGTADVGRHKLESAAEDLLDLDPSLNLQTYATVLSSDNALEIIRGYDVVIDGSDNFPTRYLVNDACVLEKKPNVYGSVFRFEGQASIFDAQQGPCYRCLYPEPPPPHLVPSCEEGGVLGVLPGIIGLIQATEAIKILAGLGSTLIGRLLLFDALKMQFRELKLRKNETCSVCGPNPTVTHLIDYEGFCGLRASEPVGAELSATELAQRLGSGDRVTLLDVREPHEVNIARLDRSIHIPLRLLPRRLGELRHGDTIVVYCHHGERSAYAADFLRQAGFARVMNLAGGIDAWSRDVDPSVRRY